MIIQEIEMKKACSLLANSDRQYLDDLMAFKSRLTCLTNIGEEKSTGEEEGMDQAVDKPEKSERNR